MLVFMRLFITFYTTYEGILDYHMKICMITQSLIATLMFIIKITLIIILVYSIVDIVIKEL